MLTTITRIIKIGFVSFWRNSWLSLTTTAIVTLTLLVISALVVLSLFGNVALTSIQDKIDVSVYFEDKTTEADIFIVKDDLNKLEEVKGVEYVSKDQALERFKAEHAEDSLILDSLSGDDNPLPASLEIKAQNPEQYEAIANTLEDPFYQQFITEDGISYSKNKAKIDRLTDITTLIRRIGFGVSFGFIIIALLVVFNSIRVTIFTRKEEIGIMKLVGASNWYIRWPFLIEGIMYGVFATVISFIIFVPLVYYLSPNITKYLGGGETNLFGSFGIDVLILGGFQLVVAILVGVISSLIAIKKHLDV